MHAFKSILAPLAVASLLATVGCASAGGVNMKEHSAAFTMGNYYGALSQAESVLENAGVDDVETTLGAHAMALESLGKMAQIEGTPTAYDGKAAEHYAKAKPLASSDPRLRARLESAMADYYGSTHRLRTALPHMRAALADAETADDAAVLIGARHGMAQMFSQMGELELAEEHRKAALEIGETTVGAQPVPEFGPALDAYLSLLDWEIDQARRAPGGAERIEDAWTKMEHALEGIWRARDKMAFSRVRRERRLARRSILQLRAAAAFAEVGNFDKAQDLYEQVNVDLDMFGGSAAIGPLGNRLDCTRARIEFSFGRIEKAQTRASTCINGASSNRDQLIVEQRLLTVLAGIREAGGDLEGAATLYEKDIGRYEQIRKAIPIEERETFFRGAGRVPWEGLVRIRAGQYRESGDAQDLVRLLEASDGMRARQLRELAGETQPPPFSLEILRAGLGRDAALVTYTMAGSEVVATAVSPSSAQAVILDVAPTILNAKLQRTTSAIANNSAPAAIQSQLSELGRALVDPLAAQLRGAKRVTVIGDGAIGSFPVELLPLEGHGLGARATVAYSPSTTFFLRSTPREVDDRLYAFGDPTYGEAPTEVGYLGTDELTRGGVRASVFLSSFSPLPETRSEVHAIAELFDGRADVLLGAEASESVLQSKPPSRHAYVHFATHGILAGQLPGLAEPALVLANEEQNDGFLTASEVSSMPLKADLAVLSACSTGTGEMLPGEGVMGMGRAFLVAGSRGVVVSLWPVDSVATEALMVSFYRHHRTGLDAGRALRNAKQEVASNPRWANPYYWSAFILVAEGGLLADNEPSQPAGEISGTPKDGDPPPLPGGKSQDRGFVLEADKSDGPPPGSFADDYEILRPFD